MCQAPPLPEEEPHGRRAPSAERGAQQLTARGRPGGLARPCGFTVPGGRLAAWPRRAEPCSHAGPAVSLASAGESGRLGELRAPAPGRHGDPSYLAPLQTRKWPGDRASSPRP
ncbi:phosphatidate phosphatase PPAPDC1A [Platysternon megacephalum]|uniref:Phosphatidate phosphatase PPAPDC1A n=1 Tax=Platysternon megacephalum TaxID=55544 RepID=A0A4D9EIP8_9SAUR|nr:phosphatidate phosphatase PPAPDC1A [Platysternon megacephalum]